MAGTTYFVQECPTCGRGLQIRVAYLGRKVACQHCEGQFQACDPESSLYPPSDSSLTLLRRAQKLLDSSDA